MVMDEVLESCGVHWDPGGLAEIGVSDGAEAKTSGLEYGRVPPLTNIAEVKSYVATRYVAGIIWDWIL